MSRSTTATTTYTLVKYSRAYDSGPEQKDQEWQHFTNPVLRLLIDVKKSANGELECFRTRVVWCLNASKDSMDLDQREVVFEDLDLLTFSAPSLLQGRAAEGQGLPLKAVYRDSVVGIRYLHPRVIPAGASATYRRFQVNFQTASLAASFIDSIKFVCPCKPNVPPPGRSLARAATMMPPMSVSSAGMGHPTQERRETPLVSSSFAPSFGASERPAAQFSRAPASVSFQPPDALPPSSPSLASSSDKPTTITSQLPPSSATRPLAIVPISVAPSSAQETAQRPSPGTNDDHYGILERNLPLSVGGASLARPSSAVSVSSALAEYSIHSVSGSSQPDARAVDQTSSHASTVFTVSTSHTIAASLNCRPVGVGADTVLLNSQQTASDSNADPQDTRMNPPSNGPGEDLMACLGETHTLYDLSRSDLEALVAKVVREEGFLKLLEDLDSMWRIKGLLGRIPAP